MTDISVIILVGKEELHIQRCLEKLAPLEPRQVFVVESQKGDRTHEIALETARSLAWDVHLRADDQFSTATTQVYLVWHNYPGYQAAQFEWALDKLPIESEWVLRLDADEYLTDLLVNEMKSKIPSIPLSVAGVILKRRHMWRDVWVKGGMYPSRILRLFRKGHGKSDGKLMDEHIVVDGKVVEFSNDFVDHSLISLADWEAKHKEYAKREAESFLSGQKSTGTKGKFKWMYYHLLPPFCRPSIYWLKRAIVDGAYFESPEARDFTYRHAFWYRSLVEKEIVSLRRCEGCGG